MADGVKFDAPYANTQCTLFQNGRYLNILLYLFKLDLDASFKANILLNFQLKNEASRANLNKNKRIFK